MIYDPMRRALEFRQRIIESMSAEELEEYAQMTESESPLDALLRTAKEVANELYYVRKDNVFQVPRGVMQRLVDAIDEMERLSEPRP